MELLSEEKVHLKYRHFSECNIPFEDTIKEILPSNRYPYSDRWNFLKSIYLITSKGYYLNYRDICNNNNLNYDDEQPYSIFLEGAVECAYSFAYTEEMEATLSFIRGILSKGKLTVTYYKGKYGFLFSLPWRSWI